MRRPIGMTAHEIEAIVLGVTVAALVGAVDWLHRRHLHRGAMAGARGLACPLCGGPLPEWDGRYTRSPYDRPLGSITGALGGFWLRCPGCDQDVRIEARPGFDGVEVGPSRLWLCLRESGLDGTRKRGDDPPAAGSESP